MGLSFVIVLVIVLCVVWRFCCKMMNGQATGKVTPFDDENPAAPAAAEDHTEDPESHTEVAEGNSVDPEGHSELTPIDEDNPGPVAAEDHTEGL